MAVTYCEGCNQLIDIDTDVDHFTDEDLTTCEELETCEQCKKEVTEKLEQYTIPRHGTKWICGSCIYQAESYVDMLCEDRLEEAREARSEDEKR